MERPRVVSGPSGKLRDTASKVVALSSSRRDTVILQMLDRNSSISVVSVAVDRVEHIERAARVVVAEMKQIGKNLAVEVFATVWIS